MEVVNIRPCVCPHTRAKEYGGMHIVKINTENFAKGFYIVKVAVNKFQYTNKLIQQ